MIIGLEKLGRQRMSWTVTHMSWKGILMSKVYATSFTHGKDRYVVMGEDSLLLPVYEVVSDRRVQKTKLLYPSCLAKMYNVFLPSAKLSRIEREKWDQRFEIVGKVP